MLSAVFQILECKDSMHLKLAPLIGLHQFCRCHRIRKAIGGGMRQAGVIAAAGIYALDHIAPNIFKDHNNAKLLAAGKARFKI